MEKYQPTLGARETARNIKGFIAENKAEFWKIFKPLMPYIIVLALLDVVITDLYMPESDNGFPLGSVISGYFFSVLAISWHRVVINGVDNYEPMNPFKPKRHELMFIVMGFVIAIGMIVAGVALVAISYMMGVMAAAVVVMIALIGFTFVFFRLCLYFPAKAVNAEITLRQVFDLSKGYLWKCMNASFFASLKMMILLFVYMIVMVVVMVPVYMSGSGVVPMAAFEFILTLPMVIYFSPILTIIGVTVLSNYYLYALQHQEQAIEGE